MKSLVLTAALASFGLTTSLVTQATTPLVATARVISPDGTFFDREWNIAVYYQNNSYHYN